jgi:hypothetical protein
MLIEPPRPPVDTPLWIDNQPLFPDTDPPLPSDTLPETPADDTFALLTWIEPDDDDALDPLTRNTDPPLLPAFSALPPVNLTIPPDVDAGVDVPASRTTSPPEPLLPWPTTTLTDPARPPVLDPVPKKSHPVFPDADDPVDTITVPDSPADATSSLAMETEPEPVLTLVPEMNTTAPP